MMGLGLARLGETPALRGLALCLLALVLLLGLAASTQTAEAVEFAYLVNNKQLKDGESRELLKAADEFPYKFERVSGTPSVNFECKGLKIIEKATIFGGKPGDLTMKLEWTGCTGAVGGKTCTGIVATTPTPLHGEVVELVFGSNAGFAATLVYPETGGQELVRFESLCGGIPDVRVIKGSAVVEASSQCSNITELEFFFQGSSITEVNWSGGRKKVSSTIEGSPARITGSTSFFLFFSPKWGIC